MAERRRGGRCGGDGRRAAVWDKVPLLLSSRFGLGLATNGLAYVTAKFRGKCPFGDTGIPLQHNVVGRRRRRAEGKRCSSSRLVVGDLLTTERSRHHQRRRQRNKNASDPVLELTSHLTQGGGGS